jgi:hypothetical protein
MALSTGSGAARIDSRPTLDQGVSQEFDTDEDKWSFTNELRFHQAMARNPHANIIQSVICRLEPVAVPEDKQDAVIVMELGVGNLEEWRQFLLDLDYQETARSTPRSSLSGSSLKETHSINRDIDVSRVRFRAVQKFVSGLLKGLQHLHDNLRYAHNNIQLKSMVLAAVSEPRLATPTAYVGPKTSPRSTGSLGSCFEVKLAAFGRIEELVEPLQIDPLDMNPMHIDSDEIQQAIRSDFSSAADLLRKLNGQPFLQAGTDEKLATIIQLLDNESQTTWDDVLAQAISAFLEPQHLPAVAVSADAADQSDADGVVAAEFDVDVREAEVNDDVSLGEVFGRFQSYVRHERKERFRQLRDTGRYYNLVWLKKNSGGTCVIS